MSRDRDFKGEGGMRKKKKCADVPLQGSDHYYRRRGVGGEGRSRTEQRSSMRELVGHAL